LLETAKHLSYMKTLNQSLLLFGFSALFFTACTPEPDLPPYIVGYGHGASSVNEGNCISASGDVSHYNNGTGQVTNHRYPAVNGVVLAAYIEHVRVFGDNAYIVGSNQGGAKVVAVDKATFTEKGRIEGLEIPRDLAVADNQLLIADWGNYDEEGNYTNPNSFIAVADLNGGSIIDRIPVSSRPQSIVAHLGIIYVVCEEGKEILKINPTSKEIVARRTLEATPKELLISGNQLMLYSTLGGKLHLDQINTTDLSSTKAMFDIPNSSRLVLDNQGQAWVLTSAYSEDYSYTDNAVITVSITGAGTPKTIYEARNLRGIGIDEANGRLYIADDNGIQGNGTVVITDEEGVEITKLNAGRVPSKFYFY